MRDDEESLGYQVAQRFFAESILPVPSELALSSSKGLGEPVEGPRMTFASFQMLTR